MAHPTPLPVRAPDTSSERGRETKERLLDAAERVFAERGFEGTSLRAVTQAAGTSVSAANYHFGSKDVLLRATILRRIEPINQRRLELLDELEAQSNGVAPDVHAVIGAFLVPVFEQTTLLADATSHYREVAARLYSEPREHIAAVKKEYFGPLIERFEAALARALPEKSPEEIGLGLQFIIGVMVHVISGNLAGTPSLAWNSDAVAFDDTLLQRVTHFAAAGISGETK